MQGDRVPHDVIKSLNTVFNHDCDLILLSIGGGSAADLRWFDSEEIAVAIANGPIPIIAAIGHHDDTCVAEAVAHTREKTPTAAADRILDIFWDTRSRINECAHTLAVALDREVTRLERTQSDLRERLSQAVDADFSRHRERLTMMTSHIQRSFDHIYARQNQHFLMRGTQMAHYAVRDCNL